MRLYTYRYFGLLNWLTLGIYDPTPNGKVANNAQLNGLSRGLLRDANEINAGTVNAGDKIMPLASFREGNRYLETAVGCGFADISVASVPAVES